MQTPAISALLSGIGVVAHCSSLAVADQNQPGQRVPKVIPSAVRVVGLCLGKDGKQRPDSRVAIRHHLKQIIALHRRSEGVGREEGGEGSGGQWVNASDHTC